MIRSFGILALLSSFSVSAAFAQNESTNTLELPAQEIEWNNSRLVLSTGMSIRSIEDEFTTARQLRVDAGVSGSTEFTPWLSGRMGLKFVTIGGSSISSTGEFRPKSLFAFEETLIELKPFQGVAAQAGFVEVRTSTSADILQAGDHPGLKLLLSSGTLGAILNAEVFSVIPTSNDSTPRYFPDDGNPTLSGFSLAAKFVQDQGAFGEVRLSRLNFQGLTPSIAQDSRLAGNDIAGLGSKSARFVYDFDTDEINALVGYRLSNLGVSFEGTQARNRKAPTSVGTGVHGEAVLKYQLPKLQLRASYGEFFVGSEVYPGSIAGDLFYYNNRQGRQISAGAVNLKETLGARVTYITYNEIIDQPYLADRTYVGLRFFAKKDLFSGSRE